jgi:hypothetical protein
MKILAPLFTLLCLPSVAVASEAVTQDDNNNEIEQQGNRRLGYTQAPRLPTIEKWISRRPQFATLYNLLDIAGLAPPVVPWPPALA